MGVHGLWKLLESTGKPINPETLEGKILAVDISIWLNQAVKGVRDREGNSVQNAHLLTLFHRLCKLLFFRIRPVFVFDGDAPLIKKQTLAIRRQRKEEKTMESKQTNDKLLKTFLKRQAIKAALGEESHDHLPSLSGVRREEDMYMLPALPALEERERGSSEEEQEEEEDSRHIYQGDFYEDSNSVDINSEEFSAMPPEVKHEILKDMKEFSKRRRTMYHTPPERSGDFSQYQLAGLLQRNELNARLVGVEREMSNRSAGNAPGVELYNQGEGHSVETRRLLSEDSTHYILIKGPKKTDNSERVPDIQPAASPWLGGPLSGRVRAGGGERPEPLWRPISEEESLEEGPSSSSKHPQGSNPSLGDAAPPSPRTLKAIQAAMDASFSDEEEGSSWGRGSWGRGGSRAGEEGSGSVSPRTILAIQRAMGEDLDVGTPPNTTLIGNSPVKPHPPSPQRPANRLVVTSSSEEETEGKDTPLRTTLTNEDRLGVEKGDEQQSPLPLASHSSCRQGGQFGSGSQCYPPSGPGLNREKERERSSLVTGPLPPSQQERERSSLETGPLPPSQQERERSSLETGPLPPSQQERGRSSLETGPLPQSQQERERSSLVTGPLPPSQQERNGHDTNTREERNGEIVKMEDSEEESDSESFVDVSEGEELKEEETDDSLIEVGGGAPPKAQEDVTKKEEEEEEEEALSSRAVPLEERDDDDEEEEEALQRPTEPSPASVPVPNEWEDINVDELVALESRLGEQQSSLREQKQQQERVAATVTGQMCLESQELLRLFGVPFLVAPSEAEAQCAALDRTDQTHGTITDDSDVWLFGGRHVYKNFFSQNTYVEHYQYIDLQNQLGVDRTKLINLAYLLGSDYTEGIPGVGYVTGMEILNEFPGPGMEPVSMFSEWWSLAQQQRLTSDPRDSKVKRKLRGLQLQPGFPNPAVATAYLQPSVDLSEGSFSWGRPHLDLIKEFCQSRFGWNSRKTEETLQPVITQLNTQQTQLRIDSFFRLEQQERQAIKSQRLRRAVTCMKRKEREEEGEGVCSPSKAKRGKGSGPKQREGGVEEGTGGFLGAEVSKPAPEDVGRASHDMGGASQQRKEVPPPNKGVPEPKLLPRRAEQNGSGSSGDDSDGGGGVTMVTAQSVFGVQPR
ncbi:DNA excision repair protein ERCC-5-like, partial [Coregonus clupeaformis]|uniref:DNA excision repair protein ERCC-5-like n=1 Tax=Coregonus clupeaformis TaxID=59861 RepID=UPI001E1C2D99